MKRIACIVFGLLFFWQCNEAQPLVGLKKAEIIAYMKINEPDFALDNTVVNKKYNYLKYYDKTNEETILCFMTTENVCNILRRMSDYANLDATIKKLNKNYKKIGKDKWSYTANHSEFVIELKREKWYFTMDTRMKK